jgi:hypothetical protein
MKHSANRTGLALVVLAAGLVAGACAGSSSTPEVIYTTLPTGTPVLTPSPTAVPTPTVEATATPTPTPTAPAVTSPPGAKCTGSAGMKQWFAAQATHFSWTVYCAVLPTGWSIMPSNGATAGYNSGGWLIVGYDGPGDDVLLLYEGNYCDMNCSPYDTVIGPAKLGDMNGTLYTSGPFFVIYVNPGTRHAYAFMGQGMSQSKFKSYAAALIKVPKP